MHSFFKNLYTPEGVPLRFLFTRMHTVHGVRYFVWFKDESHTTYKFYMVNVHKDLWMIAEDTPLPGWVVSMEKKFEDAINGNL